MIRKIFILPFAFMLLSIEANSAATLDRTVCSIADKSGGNPSICDGQEQLNAINNEISKLYNGSIIDAVITGTNTLAGTTSPVATSLADGETRRIRIINTNSGPVTYDDNGLGAKQLTSQNGSALGSGDLQANSFYIITYYASNDEWRVLTNIGTGTASASNPYVTVGNTGSLSSERALIAGTALGLTDGGADSTVTIGLTDPELTCLAALTSSVDKVAYYTGSGTCALTGLSSLIRGLLDDSSTSAAQATLGLVIGTNVQAFDSDLSALAGNSTAGLWAYTGAGTGAARTVTGTSNEVAVTNGNGASGNPTISLPSTLALSGKTISSQPTWGAGSDFQWLFDPAGTSNPTISFTNAEAALTNADGASPSFTIGDNGSLKLQEESANGSNYLAFNAPTAVTTNQTCTLENDASFIPDGCVGDGVDGGLISTQIDTSAEIAAIVSDETGSGTLVFSASPTFTGTVSGAASTWSGNVTLSGTSANLQVGSNYISYGGTDEGISVTSGGYVSITSNVSAAGLAIYNNAANGQARLTLTPATGGVGQIVNTDGHFYLTNTPATSDIIFRAGSSVERARITYDGKVGIGTSAPGQTLDVQGAAQFGSGNVNLITSAGQLTGLSSTYVATSTSSDLAGVISDETGSGSLVFGTSPTFTTNVTLGSDTVSDFTGLGLALSTGSLGLDSTGATDEFCLTYEGTGPTVQWQACGGGGGGSPGGSSNQLQFNNAGVFDGVTLSGDVTLSMPSGAATVVSASTSTAGKVELATDAEAEAGTDTGRAVTPSGLLASIAGKKTIWVPAAAMTAETTTGCAAGTVETATNQIMYKSLDCDAATKEGAQFTIAMPKSWNESTITFRADWTAASGSGNVVWAFSCLSVSNDDPLDAAFGTEVTVTDSLTAAGDLDQSPESGAVTASGTPAENDTLLCRVQRDAASGSDTLGVDARLLGVRILYSTNAMTDD